MGWPIGDERLRAMYAGGRGDRIARAYARFWSAVIAYGWLPRRWVTLEVVGRRSGLRRRFPLGMADVGVEWFLVSMLGEGCSWVRNVRAAEGVVVLRRRGRAHRYRLTEVAIDRRAPILRRYVQKVPGARPHIPVDPRAPLEAFVAVAGRYPVFRVRPEARPPRS